MRIVADAHRDTSAFALDTRTEYSGCGSLRPRPNVSRHKFAAAISWLPAHLIESLAAYGEAMYPCFVDPGDLTNGQKPERTTPNDQAKKAGQ